MTWQRKQVSKRHVTRVMKAQIEIFFVTIPKVNPRSRLSFQRNSDHVRYLPGKEKLLILPWPWSSYRNCTAHTEHFPYSNVYATLASPDIINYKQATRWTSAMSFLLPCPRLDCEPHAHSHHYWFLVNSENTNLTDMRCRGDKNTLMHMWVIVSTSVTRPA